MQIDRERLEIMQSVIEHIAKSAEALAWQAGVGGMETAGSLVSYLAEHPRDLEPFLNGGVFELPPNWHERGRLTWHALNGQVVTPEFTRQHKTISRMIDAGGHDAN